MNGTQANSAIPDETPENASSDLGLHCLLKRKSNQPDIPKMKTGLFQIIRMEESIRLKRVNITIPSLDGIASQTRISLPSKKRICF